MKTINVYTGVSDAFLKRSPFTLHNRNACHMAIHAGTTIDMYSVGYILFRWQTRLRACSSQMWNLPIYGYNKSMMLLFTQSSRIRSVNVGSHAIIFKSLHFGHYTETQPWSFQTKTGSAAFKKSLFSTFKMPE